jgi:hypothetical protein
MTAKTPSVPTRVIDLLLQSEGWKSGVRHPYELKDADGKLIVTLYFPVRSRAVTMEIHNYVKSLEPKNDSEGVTHWLIKTAQLENGEPAFSIGDFNDLRAQLPDDLLGDLELFAIKPHALPKKKLPEQIKDEKND